MDKDEGGGGGLNVWEEGWTRQGKVMGQKGDNCNWTTIKKLFKKEGSSKNMYKGPMDKDNGVGLIVVGGGR